MNPEFRRNLWLELTPRRIVLAVVLLSLVFFAAALTGSENYTATAAQFLYYAIVVVWGTRNAALSVVGEIRDRTWDAQRLSSFTAGQMLWGKLFGSTIYNWLAGGLCLAVIEMHSVVQDGPPGALTDLVYFIAVGTIAQAAALLASLLAVQRRRTHSRGEVSLYQLAGLLAAAAVYFVWNAAHAAGIVRATTATPVTIPWWGRDFDAKPFLLVSLALFTGWTLLGCYREMRLELKMRNGSLAWLAFLIFIGIYVSGFDSWLSHTYATEGWDALSLRLGLAMSAFGVLAYVMVLIEPKDRVHFRRLGAQFMSGRIGATLQELDGFLMSYIALILTAGFLIGRLWPEQPQQSANIALIAAGVGFVTRDVAIFVFFGTLSDRRNGDFRAVLALAVLYLLAPSILSGLGLGGAFTLFYPQITRPPWLAPFLAWAEALAVAVPTLTRLALRKEKKATQP